MLSYTNVRYTNLNPLGLSRSHGVYECNRRDSGEKATCLCDVKARSQGVPIYSRGWIQLLTTVPKLGPGDMI